MADGVEPGERVVIVRGLLAGVEATVVRPTRFGRFLIELDPDAPRWAAIRRVRAAGWAIAPVDRPSPSAAPALVLARRRRIAHLDLAAALVLLPLLLRVWNVVPALSVVLGAGALAGLAALHATDRAPHPRRTRDA